MPIPPFSGPSPHCWTAPSILAATVDLLDYRETRLSLAILGGFYRDALAAIDAALAWRAEAPEECHFWPEAEGFSLVAERDGWFSAGNGRLTELVANIPKPPPR